MLIRCKIDWFWASRLGRTFVCGNSMVLARDVHGRGMGLSTVSVEWWDAGEREREPF